MKRLVLLVCLCVLVLFALNSFAQSTADLHVGVKDPKGAAVTNATVTVNDPTRGFERKITQNENGEYRALQLPPGKYSVTVEAAGFAKTVLNNVTITVGQIAELPVSMRIAERTEAIEVSGETEQVETQRTSVATTITQQRIDNLPINGRNYINFTLTNSQTARDNAPSIGAAPTSGLNIGGQRARANLVTVDGMDATDNSVNGIRSTAPQDAVQEFQITTNGYAAEYGRASGGVVGIITRSGTNDIHGSAFGELRNRKFQATNPFSTVDNPAYTRVLAGASLGGPIKKDKTYYFLSYELTRRQETGFSTVGQNNFNLTSVNVNPYVDALAFPGFCAAVFAATNGCNVLANPEQAAFFATPPPVPLSAIGQYALLVGGASGTAVNGTLPPWVQAVAGAPTATQFISSCNPTNTLCNGLPASFHDLTSQMGNYPVSEGTTLVHGRLDHRFTSNNNLMLSVNVSPSTITGINVQGQNQNFGQNAFSRTAYQQFRDLTIGAQDTATLGSNKINEFRFQYGRRGLLFNYNTTDPKGADVAVNIVGFAFAGREPFSLVRRVEQRFQFADNFSWIKGKHNFKFGADINHLPLVADFTVNFGGVYNFGQLDASSFGFPSFFPGFSAPQAYGLGVPSTLVQGLGNPHDEFSNNILGFFAQDSWRVTPRFTVNYGVRYDVELMPGPKPLSAAGQAGYDFLGLTNAVPRDTNNISPRIGIAWDPTGTGKTVVRASYGMFYDHPLLALQFLAQATDASATPQILLAGGAPCSTNPSSSPINATNTFQGILQTANCLGAVGAGAFGYLPNQQRFDPNAPSLFLNQGFIGAGVPLGFMPFGFPNTQNFQYAYSDQANLSIEHDLGHNFSINVAYNFNGGHHLNRPINGNTPRTDLLVGNWERAMVAATNAGLTPASANWPTNPLSVGVEDFTQPFYNPCGVVNGTQIYAPAPLMNFFRPSGLNPSLTGVFAACVPAAAALAGASFSGIDPTTGFPTSAPLGVPFADMNANYATGSSVYHGLTVNLRKRFSKKYEFLASYTWSHSIDDSTDLESPLSPQDSYNPSAERSNSAFDQRHRFVFSAVYQSGRLDGSGFMSKLFSDWTVAPILEISSGRPFPILTADPVNFQFAPNSARPNVVPVGTATDACGNPAVPNPYSPLGAFQVPCMIDGNPTDGVFTGSLNGNLGRNAGTRPYTLFNDLRIARRIHLGERVGLDAMVDMFNLINKNNVADVNYLYTQAGTPTAAYDPRQFQFGLRLTF